MANTDNNKVSPNKKLLNFWDLFFIAIGQVIGAGVIALTGVAIGMTGPSVIIAFGVAALLVLIVSVPIIVAGAALPVSGAYYVWPSRLGSGRIASVVLMLILAASVTLSLYGSAFGLYLNPLFPILSVNSWGVVVIAAVFLINLFGLDIAAKLQMVLVLVLLSALSIYAGFAMPHIDSSLLLPLFPKGWLGFVAAVFLLQFATSGAFLVVGLGGETQNPGKTIPRVIILSTVFVAAIYMIVALASVGVVPWQSMIDQPLTVAGRAFLPQWAISYFLIGGAGLAICTTINAQFIQLPRNFIAASHDQLLPTWLGRENRLGVPVWIISLMLVVGVTPLIANVDFGAIARVAAIAGSLPGLIIFWLIARVPEQFPQHYANSLFSLNRFWLRFFVVASWLLTVAGIVILGQDLSLELLLILLGAIVCAFTYYPLRRRYLASQGIDLDRLTADRSVFVLSENSAGEEADG